MTDTALGQAFNPLTPPPSEEVVLGLQQSTVANIRDSYHGRYDSFAESVQNAVDALAKRWQPWQGPGQALPGAAPDEHPQLRVIIDCNQETVHVIDNGTGIEDEMLRQALVPNVSLKRGEADQRGHKGVGTTYLTYGHNLFSVESKTASGTRHYRLVQGLSWVKSDPPDTPPEFEPLAPSDSLADFASGTAVTMQFGDGTNYGNLSTAFYNTPKLWEIVLRSYTAIGLVALRPIGQTPPAWMQHLNIAFELKGCAGAGVATLPFRFSFPHEYLPAAEIAELQALQNNPGSPSKYKLIYLSRDHTGLLSLLQPELDKMAPEDEDLKQEMIEALARGEISVYASLAYKNTFYEEAWKAAIGQEAAKRITGMNVKGGVLVASVGMPIGETLPHLQHSDVGIVLKPEERRRYFLLVHFNRTYRPDIGRKTIPRDSERVIGWLEAAIIRVLRPHGHRLQITNEDSTHNAASFAQAQQQLKENEDRYVKASEEAATYALPGLIPPRPARTETEVISQFSSLLATNRLSGYAVIALPGSESRYDGLVDVHLEKPAEELAGVAALTGISADMFNQGSFVRTHQWLEFKLRLSDLVDEFELEDGVANKKYFSQVNLAICRSSTGDVGPFELTACDANTRKTRNFPGTTHFLVRDGSDHRVEVIVLDELIPDLVAAIA